MPSMTDRTLPTYLARELYRGIKNATYVEIPSYLGHLAGGPANETSGEYVFRDHTNQEVPLGASSEVRAARASRERPPLNLGETASGYLRMLQSTGRTRRPSPQHLRSPPQRPRRMMRTSEIGTRIGRRQAEVGDPPHGESNVLLNIVNPNTTAAMTATIAAAAAKAARPDTRPACGRERIRPGFDRGPPMTMPSRCRACLRALAEGEADGADAHVIACFDDTGLDAGAGARRCAGGRDRRSGVSCRNADRASLRGRHHAGAVGAGDREQLVALRARAALRAALRATDVPVLELDNPAIGSPPRA